MGKLPYFQFFPRDWLTDPELSRCSLAARGALMDILCLMWECEKRGVLSSKGKPWKKDDIALAIRGDVNEVTKCLEELISKGALDQTQSGAIYSRRMVRDEVKREAWRRDQSNHRVRAQSGSSQLDVSRMSGGSQADVNSMSTPSSYSYTEEGPNFTFPQDAMRLASDVPNKKTKWIDRDEERRRKNRQALDATLPESPQVAGNPGGDIPEKPAKRRAD